MMTAVNSSGWVRMYRFVSTDLQSVSWVEPGSEKVYWVEPGSEKVYGAVLAGARLAVRGVVARRSNSWAVCG